LKGGSVAERHRLKFHVLAGHYAVVRFAADAEIPEWTTRGAFTSVTRTSDELSIVCPAENLPVAMQSHRWACLKIEGSFPFSQTGVLLSFIQPLSESGVPIFALSTYDTDYVLIQEEFVKAAVIILQQAGHKLTATT
jgi:uncharacterized protein